MKNKVTVLIVECDNPWVDLVDITPWYPTLRAIIGGDVMEVRLENDVVILCRDSFPTKVIREFSTRTIYGRCFIVIGRDHDDGKYRSLTAKEINKYKCEFEGCSL